MTNKSDKNIKLWLKMEEGTGSTTNDEIAANDGTLVGTGTTWATGGRPAREGKFCININGESNMNVLIENSNGEVWNGSSSFTVAIWFLRTGNNTASSLQFAFCHAGSGTNNRIYLTVGTTSPSIAANVGSTAVTGTSFTEGVWNHGALSHNALTGISYLYLNGNLVGSASTALGTGTYDMFLGALSASTNQVLNGNVDDVRFYSRFMNQAEIRAIMQGAGYAK